MWEPFLLLFSTILFLSPTTAEIKTLTINSDSGTRPVIFFEKFGFTLTGHVTISVAVLSSSSQLESPRLGFILINDKVLPQILIKIQQNPSFCVLDYPYIYPLFTFRDLYPPPFNHCYPIFATKEYSLFFANCASEISVSMVVHTEIFNLDSNGFKDYLSARQTQLPLLFFLFFLAYLTFFVFWVYTCYINKCSIHHRIHLLMTILLLMKCLNLIFAAEDKHHTKVTGLRYKWNMWFYIFQFIRVVLLFTVIVLIGAGWWSFLKPFLQDREKKALITVIPLQVLANLTSVVIGDTNPSITDWVTWTQVVLLVDIICCCAFVFPIVCFIRLLREILKTDGRSARNVAKLTLFRQFYIVIIGYLCFTRIVVFALKTIAAYNYQWAYKYQWVSNAIEEMTGFVFFIVMFYMFRPPVEKNEYFVLDENEEEVAEIALRNESFCSQEISV